jgi:hypothetical protein
MNRKVPGIPRFGVKALLSTWWCGSAAELNDSEEFSLPEDSRTRILPPRMTHAHARTPGIGSPALSGDEGAVQRWQWWHSILSLPARSGTVASLDDSRARVVRREWIRPRALYQGEGGTAGARWLEDSDFPGDGVGPRPWSWRGGVTLTKGGHQPVLRIGGAQI